MNRSSVTYEPEEGDMKFSEHDRKIIGSKVAKATFKGGVSRLKGKGGEKRIIWSSLATGLTLERF